MAARTIRIWGQGFGATPVQINAVVNGNTVYTGPAPTLNIVPPEKYEGEGEVLFTFEVDTAFEGTIPVSLTVTGGSLTTTKTDASYGLRRNPNLTLAEDAEFDLENPLQMPQAVADKGGWHVPGGPTYFSPMTNSDSKLNVTINGSPQTSDPLNFAEALADWYWNIPAGGTMTWNCNVVSAPTGTPV